ncbi:MAG: YebC/PmpR family DNA-binding transcriptional regulator [Verrucomicrobiota bacterium]|nr:YebC/PmpR family DNA-binding transcriptional regulator [Verrucomicrobiota bacterium]
MAGHSKWANIKYRKDRADRKKGKFFSRAIKEIISAVKQGGPDTKANSKLRIAIEKAKEGNVPHDTIERNIKKASDPGTEDFLPFQYELYGFGGVGILASGLTDNRNRTASEIQIVINKCGGVLAKPGSVAFNFNRQGVIDVEKESIAEDVLFLLVSSLGAEEMEIKEDCYHILTSVETFAAVKEAIEKEGGKIVEAELAMVPKVWVESTEEEAAANVLLIERLEGLDDVDALYHNMAL